jgi:hypothetical protein
MYDNNGNKRVVVIQLKIQKKNYIFTSVLILENIDGHECFKGKY